LASHAKVVHRSAQREGGPPALRVSFGRGSRLRSRLPTNELRMASQPSRRLPTVAAFSVSPEPEGGPSSPPHSFENPIATAGVVSRLPFFGSPRFLRIRRARCVPTELRGFRKAVRVRPPKSVHAEALLHRRRSLHAHGGRSPVGD
jgi:hypothetical protein